MKKSMFMTLLCALLVCAFAVPSLYAVDAPGDMMLKAPAGAKMKKAPVAFSHGGGHKDIDCTVCHHTWDGKSAVKSCAAEGCHTDMKDKKGPASFYKAFHDKKSKASCVGCHKIEKKGPKKCAECHPKKKK